MVAATNNNTSKSNSNIINIKITTGAASKQSSPSSRGEHAEQRSLTVDIAKASVGNMAETMHPRLKRESQIDQIAIIHSLDAAPTS